MEESGNSRCVLETRTQLGALADRSMALRTRSVDQRSLAFCVARRDALVLHMGGSVPSLHTSAPARTVVVGHRSEPRSRGREGRSSAELEDLAFFLPVLTLPKVEARPLESVVRGSKESFPNQTLGWEEHRSNLVLMLLTVLEIVEETECSGGS